MTAKVLIADDHASVRRSIRAILESSGKYEVCCEAKDGLEAVRLAKQCKHDVVVIDLLMPSLNGFRVAGRDQPLRSRRSHCAAYPLRRRSGRAGSKEIWR